MLGIALAVLGQISVGERVEVDVAGDRRAVPAICVEYARGRLGAAAALVIANVPGIRAEARVLPFRWLYAGIGAALFGSAFAPRAVVGVGGSLGTLHLGADVAFEYAVSGPPKGTPYALVLAVGAGWQF